MQRNKKEVAILNTAIRCIGKHGIEKTNAQLIAKGLGVAPSGIFYYFETQELLFDSLVSYIAGLNHDLVSKIQAKSPRASHRERLFLHLEGNLLWGEKYPEQVAVLLVSMAKTGYSAKMRDLVNRLFQVGEDRIYSLLTAGIAEKEIYIATDIRDTAAYIHKALTGHIICQYYAGRKQPSKYFSRLLRAQLENLLRTKPG